MNLPNILSVFRLFVTSFFIIAIYYGRFKLALGLFVLQGVTDLLDGLLARLLKAKTSLGAYLDPLADKVMLVSSYIVLCIIDIMPLWVTAIVLLRDIIVPAGFLLLYKLSYKMEVSPSLLGKITTFCQIITVAYVLWSDVRSYEEMFFYTTAFVTAVSGLHYIYVGLRMFFSKRPAYTP